MRNEPYKFLFLCTGNSARSIFGEYLLRRSGGARFEVFSAGSFPTGKVNPLAIRVLKDIYDIDASAARSKSWEEFSDVEFDFVVTVCDNARESCPVWPGQPIVAHWGFPDPAAVDGTESEKYRAFAEVASQIYRRIQLFICPTITGASAGDLPEILDLLTQVQLPHDGVAENVNGFFVARDEGSRLVATIGFERHGSTALLRSAAVSPEYQGCGLGSRLTSHLLERAKKDGVERVVLLTSTASEFFARHFGFCETPRSAFDKELAPSAEWNLPRCSTAVCMSLKLKEEGCADPHEDRDP
jgi:arsenate reductase (thioredoxin)